MWSCNRMWTACSWNHLDIQLLGDEQLGGFFQICVTIKCKKRALAWLLMEAARSKSTKKKNFGLQPVRRLVFEISKQWHVISAAVLDVQLLRFHLWDPVCKDAPFTSLDGGIFSPRRYAFALTMICSCSQSGCYEARKPRGRKKLPEPGNFEPRDRDAELSLFFLLVGCGWSLGYWQSITTVEKRDR